MRVSVIVPIKKFVTVLVFQEFGHRKRHGHLNAVLPHLLLNHEFVVHRYFSCTSSGVADILKRSAEVVVPVHNFSTFILPEFMYLRIVFTYILCLLILSKFICLPTDAQLNCLKNNFKIYIKIDIKTARTCFSVITIIREHTIRSC